MVFEKLMQPLRGKGHNYIIFSKTIKGSNTMSEYMYENLVLPFVCLRRRSRDRNFIPLAISNLGCLDGKLVKAGNLDEFGGK
jgi:hypothetical protein